MKKLQPAQFQFVVRAKVKKGTRPTRKEIERVVEHWIKGTEEPPPGWNVRVIVWGRDGKREITEIDNSSRGEVLRSILQRGLLHAQFRVNTMGGGRIRL
jgi:hypothetical protein